MAFTITPSKRWWSFNAPVRPRSLGSLGAEGMEGFESGFGKAVEGRAFVREDDPREGPYSRSGTPYVPHNVVYSGTFPEKHQLQAPLQIPTGSRGFSGFGDIVTTIKSFFTLHPWLTIGGLAAAIGFGSGAFKGLLKNPFEGEDEENLFEDD